MSALFSTSSPFGGVRVISDHNALEATEERLFPVSKHRSKRIHKKLVKRHGGEFRMCPAIFQLSGGVIVAHPARYAEIQAVVGGRP